MTPTPPDFVARTIIAAVFYDNGWRDPEQPERDGPWLVAGSTTAPGRIRVTVLADEEARTFALAPDSRALAEALAAEFTPAPLGALTAFRAEGEAALARIAGRAYHLARALPTEPLDAYRDELARAGLDPDAAPATEAERTRRERIGQDRFRAALMEDWSAACPVTGIADPALLRASHIVPWHACASDAERLDVHNGLLLSALWDAAFDAGLVTFTDEGRPVFATALSPAARTALEATRAADRLRLREGHRHRLHWHNEHVFLG